VVAKVTDSLLMAREMFPGKANSLDALCRRLEVDNSNRTLHGALLDAGLLAEVYIRMTRGQGSLVIDSRPTAAAAAAGRADRPAPSRCRWSCPAPTKPRPTKPCWPTWTRPAAARRCGGRAARGARD
jgi:DNA polymerase III epsilon subunit-like protein